MAEFEAGFNLPWIEYGQDFGPSAWRPRGGLARSDRRELLRRELGRVAGTDARLVRWWLLADGRSGLREDAAGRLLGLDERTLDDLDVAVAALREAGLRALFVLVDFLWFDAPRLVDGVRLGGRRNLARDPARRAGLLEGVFAPIAERFGREAAIAGWDLVNEPEWATLAVGTLDPRRSLSRREMRTFLAELAAVFRDRARQPLTVGLASARWLPLLDGIDLDLVQFHWYESLDTVASLARPVAARGLGGRPCLLGEFPTGGSSLAPDAILEIARGAGYAGALAWSLRASDRATDAVACASCLVDWSRRRGGPPARA
jgi:hypothetical protein